MRRKQTITISGMEMNIITEADQQQVEQIVGMVDRTIREIRLKSSGCSLTEAAILCALDANSERLDCAGRIKELEESNLSLEQTVEDMTHRMEALSAEISSLKTDNKIMREILASAAHTASAPKAAAPAQPAPEPEPAKPAEEPKKEEENTTQTIHRTPRSKSRGRVGAMFDLLTFDDV